MRELDQYNRIGLWPGPPSREDCVAFAETLRQKGIDLMDMGIKGIMEDDAK